MRGSERESERHSVREERQDDTAALSVREDLNQLYCGHHYFYYYDHLHFAAPTHTYMHIYTQGKQAHEFWLFTISPLSPFLSHPLFVCAFFSGRECKCAPRTRVCLCVACFRAA